MRAAAFFIRQSYGTTFAGDFRQRIRDLETKKQRRGFYVVFMLRSCTTNFFIRA